VLAFQLHACSLLRKLLPGPKYKGGNLKLPPLLLLNAKYELLSTGLLWFAAVYLVLRFASRRRILLLLAKHLHFNPAPG
jgi:hypothetical protein